MMKEEETLRGLVDALGDQDEREALDTLRERLRGLEAENERLNRLLDTNRTGRELLFAERNETITKLRGLEEDRDNALHRVGRLSEELRNTTQKLRAAEEAQDMFRSVLVKSDLKLDAALRALERIERLESDPQRIARTALSQKETSDE